MYLELYKYLNMTASPCKKLIIGFFLFVSKVNKEKIKAYINNNSTYLCSKKNHMYVVSVFTCKF
jgi:hypothetical protein